VIDIGIMTGSSVGELLESPEGRTVATRFGEVEVATGRVGPWRVGSIARHLAGHRRLSHAVDHRANLAALKRLGARAILASTVVGTVDPSIPLATPILFDDLFFPENRLPGGEPCTIFDDPDDPKRGHLIQEEPYSPRLRQKILLAAGELGLDLTPGGVYGCTNGPRFETKAEVGWLKTAGVAAVSQTCGPETVLAGELEIPYALVGFPVNRAAGVGEPEPEEVLDQRLARGGEVLRRLLLHAVTLLTEEDFSFDHGYVYRVER